METRWLGTNQGEREREAFWGAQIFLGSLSLFSLGGRVVIGRAGAKRGGASKERESQVLFCGGEKNGFISRI